ncbi:MAG: hypothetical protein GY835_06830 [bacterium]|nr:hypothetical protein [bacterium]
MRRSAFAPTPYTAEADASNAHPAFLILTFCAVSLSIGFAWTPDKLLVVTIGVGLFLGWPAPNLRPLKVLLGFLPLLLLVPLMHCLVWRGFGEGLPWRWEPTRVTLGLTAAARLALWILISARAIGRLHPAACLARLPRNNRFARLMLAPMLALSCLSLMVREAFLLERAWRARGGMRGRNLRAAHWPSLLLPLFRNLLARSESMADSLQVRGFPERWAGSPLAPPRAGDILPSLMSILLLIWIRLGM